MNQQYFSLKQHPDVITHVDNVLEVPEHVSMADVPLDYWCESWPCKYAVKSSGPVDTKCPKCGNDTVCPLPF